MGNRSVRRPRAVRRYRVAHVYAAALLVIAPVSASAQRAPAEYELRVGVAGSTPLVRDEVVDARRSGALAGDRPVSEVRARIGIAPMLGVLARQPLGAYDAVELSAGWQPAQLQADDADGWRDVERVHVLHATASYRHALRDGPAVRGGVGLVRYGRTDALLLREEPPVRPLVEAGGEMRVHVAGVRWVLGAFAQAHGFGSAEIRRAGGFDGSVVRGGITLGALFGGAR